MNAIRRGEELTEDILRSAIKEKKKWMENKEYEFVETYMDRYLAMKDFWEYMKSKGY